MPGCCVSHEAPAGHQIIVSAPAHVQHLILARRVVKQIDRRDQIEAAKHGQVDGVAYAVLDPRRLVLLLGTCQAHHLGGNIDADDLCGAALLEQPGVEAEAAGQIQDALVCKIAHHAEEGIALGAFQRGRLRVFVIFAANMVILGRLLHTVFLLSAPASGLLHAPGVAPWRYHRHRRGCTGVIGLDAVEYDRWCERSRKGTVKVA